MKVLCFNFRPLGPIACGNTDLSYISSLGRQRDLAPIDMTFPDSRLSDLIETWRHLSFTLRHRVRLPPARNQAFLASTQEQVLRGHRRQYGWDVFYTNGRVPRGEGLGPVVRFDYIHESAETEDPAAFARDVIAKHATAAHCHLLQVSTDAQKAVFQRIGVPAEKLRVVPFYLPALTAKSISTVQEKQAKARPLRIVFVGHQAKRKGLEALLEAIRDPLIATMPLQLTIVSRLLDGPLAVSDDPRISYHKVLPNAAVLRLMAEAHVLAVPSRRETFGLVYMEGMAAGCVCLMAAGPQQREISEGGRAGLPIGPDPRALARTLLRLSEDPAYRAEIACAGLQRFKEVYAPERVAAAYKDMFYEALSGFT